MQLTGTEFSLVIPLLVLLGAVAGFFGGLLGLGGGWLVTPLLSILGLPASVCVGTSLTQMVGMSAIGAYKHFQQGHVKFRLVAVFCLPILLGVFVGKRSMVLLENLGTADFFIQICYVVYLALMGAFVFRELLFRRLTDTTVRLEALGSTSWSAYGVMGFVGFLAGIASGMMGIGGGVVIMPLLVYGFKVPTVQAVAVSIVCVLIGSVAGAVGYSIYGAVHYPAAGAILIGSVAGSYFGSLLTKYASGPKLRFIFACLLYSTALSLVLALLGLGAAARLTLPTLAIGLGSFALVTLLRDRRAHKNADQTSQVTS